MKQEDFERLKAVCENEGFEIKSFTTNPTSYIIEKKDPWEGVEFVDNGLKIRKIKSIEKGLVFYEGGSFDHINECKPSNEQAYVEELKKEAFERFGEIKEGDRFDRTPIIRAWGIGDIEDRALYKGWSYDKAIDRLYFKNLCLYQQGKWAELVKERINIDPNNYEQITECLYTALEKDKDKFRHFLASQLEKYLNEEATV